MPNEPHTLTNPQRVARRHIGRHLTKGADELLAVVDRVGKTRPDLVTPNEFKHLEAARKALLAAAKRYSVLGKALTTTLPGETAEGVDFDGD